MKETFYPEKFMLPEKVDFQSGNILPQQLFMVMTGRSNGLRPVMDELLHEVSESCEEV